MEAPDFQLVVLVGPSGSGKSTLATRLLRDPGELALSVSYTTRAPRGGEMDGREYHFIDTASFRRMVDAGEFLEWAEVHGNLYGTGRGPVQAARRVCRGMVFDIDHQGARQIRARTVGSVGVFVLPPSWAELERRLRARGTESEDAIRRRMRNAVDEVATYAQFEHVVTNDDLDRAFDEVRSIVVADRVRLDRRAGAAEHLLSTAPAPGAFTR